MILSQIIIYSENNQKIITYIGNQEVFNQDVHAFKREITSAGYFCNKQGETLIVNVPKDYLIYIEKLVKTLFPHMLVRKFN